MKTHQVQQKTERRISAALRLVFVAALLLGMLFFREIPSALALVGTVLTIVALALLSRPEKAAAATEYKE